MDKLSLHDTGHWSINFSPNSFISQYFLCDQCQIVRLCIFLSVDFNPNHRFSKFALRVLLVTLYCPKSNCEASTSKFGFHI